ncbi:hypothetical protein CR513_34167, partial [Mucuna pruriens]
MGVFAYDDEHTSTLPPAKLYKALVKDSDNIVPKVIDAFQSVEIVEGNGGPGTVKKLTVLEGGESRYVLHKIDAIDETNLVYDYSFVGGTGLHETLEKVTFQSKVVAGADGGSVVKVTVKYYTKGDAPLSDAVREESKAKGTGLFRAVEGYKIMGVVTTESEQVSVVAPARLYKAIVLDYSNVFPKALPNFVKSAEIIQGDGGPGTIKKFTLFEGYVKHKVDVVDVDNYVYHYTIVEGSVVSEALEKVSYEYKLVGRPDGGCIIKSTRKYYTKGDAQLTQEFLKANHEMSAGFTKAPHLVVHFKLLSIMEVLTSTEEFTSTVQAGRLFKALILDASNLIPKLMPAIKNVQLVEGNGGPGSIQEIIIAEGQLPHFTLVQTEMTNKEIIGNGFNAGDHMKRLKHRIEEIDQENLTYSYAVIEGDGALEKVDSISHEIKFEATENGGCKTKNVSKYHPKAGVDVKEEDFKAAKEEGLALLKALVVDAPNLIPKLLPHAVKSIELIQGDGGAGSIKQLNIVEGIQVKSVKNRIDEINEDTLTYKYTVIEGEALKDKFASIAHEIKFEAAADGGSISKVTSKYYLKGDVEVNEEDVKASKEKVLGIYKVVETYLLQNPDALITDSRLLLPKLLPQFIKEVNVIQGDGGVGTIEQVNFAEGSPFKYVKNRIDEVDNNNLVCKYTMIEGGPLGDKLESIAYEVKFEATSDGGCLCQMTSKYNVIGGFEVKEEEIKEGRETSLGVCKVVEAYLLENPQKPLVTEINVRMNCNGCVQKIKKALSGINGIYNLYIDFPQQKVTIIGWTDPEKIVKAIKKTRKMATICNIEPIESQSQPEEPSSQPTEPELPEENAQAPEATQPLETPPTQARPHEEPPKDTHTPPEATPSPTHAENNLNQYSPRTKDVGEVHVIHHNPPNFGNRFGSGHNYVGQWEDRIRYHNSPAFLQEPPQPVYVTHSYNTYRPSPYVTEYECLRSPPRLTHYNRMEHYSGDYQNGNGNITSMFSDENPNACTIV